MVALNTTNPQSQVCDFGLGLLSQEKVNPESSLLNPDKVRDPNLGNIGY